MTLTVAPTDRLCCFPLETGLRVWGWISVVLNALSAVLSLILLCTGGDLPDEERAQLSEGSLVEVRVIFAVMIGFALLGIGTSYMLVMAVNQRKRSLLLPYLISTAISIVFWVIVKLPLLLPVFLLLSPLCVLLYLCYCVHSLFSRLRTEEENQQNNVQYNETTAVTSPQYAN